MNALLERELADDPLSEQELRPVLSKGQGPAADAELGGDLLVGLVIEVTQHGGADGLIGRRTLPLWVMELGGRCHRVSPVAGRQSTPMPAFLAYQTRSLVTAGDGGAGHAPPASNIGLSLRHKTVPSAGSVAASAASAPAAGRPAPHRKEYVMSWRSTMTPTTPEGALTWRTLHEDAGRATDATLRLAGIDPTNIKSHRLHELRDAHAGILRTLHEVQTTRATTEQEAPAIEHGPSPLTTAEAATLIGCGETRVRQLIKAGHLRTVPHVGRRVLVVRESLDRLLAADRRS